jgi:hypothetical protein
MESWKKLFNNKYVLTFIKYYNLIFLIVYTIGCYIFLFKFEFYKTIFQILVALFGFNLSSQVFVGYLMSRLNFCEWQNLAFLFNLIINVLALILKVLGVFFVIKYDLIAMTVLCSIFVTYFIFYFISKHLKINTHTTNLK